MNDEEVVHVSTPSPVEPAASAWAKPLRTTAQPQHRAPQGSPQHTAQLKAKPATHDSERRDAVQSEQRGYNEITSQFAQGSCLGLQDKEQKETVQLEQRDWSEAQGSPLGNITQLEQRDRSSAHDSQQGGMTQLEQRAQDSRQGGITELEEQDSQQGRTRHHQDTARLYELLKLPTSPPPETAQRRHSSQQHSPPGYQDRTPPRMRSPNSNDGKDKWISPPPAYAPPHNMHAYPMFVPVPVPMPWFTTEDGYVVPAPYPMPYGYGPWPPYPMHPDPYLHPAAPHMYGAPPPVAPHMYAAPPPPAPHMYAAPPPAAPSKKKKKKQQQAPPPQLT